MNCESQLKSKSWTETLTIAIVYNLASTIHLAHMLLDFGQSTWGEHANSTLSEKINKSVTAAVPSQKDNPLYQMGA